MLRFASTWFVLLSAVCIGGPYLLGVNPRTRRERLYVAITLAFLAWMLLLMTPLR